MTASFAGQNSHIAVILNNQGIHALQAQHWEEAIAKLQDSLAVDPKYSLARSNLAIAYNNYGLTLARKNNKLALKQFQLSLYYAPEDQTSQQNLMGITRLMGKNPHKFSDLEALGDAARDSKELRCAIVEYQMALKLKSDQNVSAKLKECEEEVAKQLTAKVTEPRTEQLMQAAIKESSAEQAFDTAMLAESGNKWQEAAKCFQVCLDKEPTSSTAWIELYRCYCRANNIEKAQETLEQAQRSLAGSASKLKSFLEDLMQCEANVGQLEALKQTRRTFVEKFPKGAEAKNVQELINYYDPDLLEILSAERGQSQRLLDTMPVMPIRIFIAPAEDIAAGTPPFTRGVSNRYSKLARQAFKTWAEAAGPHLTFSEVGKKSEADISCQWTADLSKRVHSFAAGETAVERSHRIGTPSASALIFLDKKTPRGEDEFYSVCLHEIGHALGLPHTSHPEDVMYQQGDVQPAPAGTLKRLSQNDIRQIRQRYNQPFQASEIALAFAKAAYSDQNYARAYDLLADSDRQQQTLSQFQKSVEKLHPDSRPSSWKVALAEIYNSHVNFTLIGANEQRKFYYTMQVWQPADGSFKVTQIRRIY